MARDPYPEMLKATAGTVILLAVGVTSVRGPPPRATRYSAVFLAFGHQLALGDGFNGNTAATAPATCG